MSEHHNAHMEHSPEHPATAHLQLTDLFCVCCSESIEASLNATPHIKRAKVDFQNNTADITYDPSRITPDKIKRVERDLGEVE